MIPDDDRFPTLVDNPLSKQISSLMLSMQLELVNTEEYQIFTNSLLELIDWYTNCNCFKLK